MKIRKHRCSQCNNIATWEKMSSGKYAFFCDECVPRGCTCNVFNIEEDGIPSSECRSIMWWDKKDYEQYIKSGLFINGSISCKKPSEESFYYEYLDTSNRRQPCCEYDYSEYGFDIEENVYFLRKKDIIDIILMHRNFNDISHDYHIKINDFISNLDEVISYNRFMSSFRELSNSYFKYDKILCEQNYHFFLSIRNKLYCCKYTKQEQ